MNTNSVFSRRIDACAAIFSADRPEKVAKIAEDCGCSEHDAARRYVVGALKASVRRLQARNLSEALEQFEGEQVNDRSVSVQGESALARDVARINRENGREYTRIVNGAREVIRPEKAAPLSHKRNMGKVLGSLYVEYDASVEASAPDIVYETAERDVYALHIADAISAYINDYVSRLSKTARKTIRDLVASELSEAEIMKGRGEEAAKLRERVKYLHRNFPARDSVTARELVGMLRKYAA